MRSLRLRLALVFVVASFASVLIAFFITINEFENQLSKDVRKNIENALRYVEEKKETTSIENIVTDLNLLMNYQVEVLERPIDTLNFTESELTVVWHGTPQLKWEERNQVATAYPVTIDGQTFILQFVMKDNTISKLAFDALKKITDLTMWIGVVLIFLASSFIVKPIKALTEATKRVADGEFDTYFDTKRKDEIGQLTNSFQKMVLSVQGMLKVRQDFISNVSHEYQTPITSIKGFAKALKEKQLSTNQQQEYLTIIENEAERLSKLSDNVLKLSHMQYDELKKLELSDVSLDKMLRETVILLNPQANKKEIEWVVQLHSVFLQADEMLLKQLWINILGNAIHFSPIGGSIIVQLRQQDEKIVVKIMDEGPGILEEQLPFIFNPFYKSVESAGNGLGLTIVKTIVDKHNGNINIQNLSPVGLDVTVTLNRHLEKNLS